MKPFHFRDTEAYRDIAARAYYVLTHAAEQDGRRSTTYFGDVLPASFDPEEELTAAVWSRIQMEAEKIIKEDPEAEGSGHGPEGERCPCEGCEAEVIDVMHLPDYMDDEEWVTSIQSARDGRVRYDRLMGVLLWWEGRCDSPPPGAASREDRMLDWLAEKGSVHTVDPHQVSLSTAVM